MLKSLDWPGSRDWRSGKCIKMWCWGQASSDLGVFQLNWGDGGLEHGGGNLEQNIGEDLDRRGGVDRGPVGGNVDGFPQPIERVVVEPDCWVRR